MLAHLLSLTTITIYLIGSAIAIEDEYKAAQLARHLVESVKGVGTISTIFPSGDELEGHPFSLEVYYASCYNDGSLTLLSMPISQSYNNIIRDSHHRATISVMPLDGSARASNYRVGLIGHVSFLDSHTSSGLGEEGERLRSCYLLDHPDSSIWLPPHGVPHQSYFVRFDIDRVWYIGGFGSSHYIGYIPLELYAAAATWFPKYVSLSSATSITL
ncbi:hypothetical protein E3P81_00479 [Wallemia ichthyophaga]|nr:hypothetical protein E3P97_00481 [Wallemia ichthyophaga]TIB06383.1 hypothetical protein E3P96_00469 [Wallemia ichthyophaga]TIB32361.1 hypothetical protein E3P85_01882 [Wallemia ichthyophaga]TIB50275.1 hypothetical protein E3P82_00555 [Wallemia ichthyophaga]TIB54012.1 hypothetical protein E3P81_00479 [Wallemia ichthyophaga]